MSPPPSQPTDPVWFQLFNEIGIIGQLSGTAFERELPDGLSMAGFKVLNHLARLPGDWGPARLAAAFQVTKGAMTNTLQRLEAAGFIVIEADPLDARAKFARVTPLGLNARDAAVRGVGPLLTAVAAGHEDHEAKAAVAFLTRLRIWLDEHRTG